MNPRPVGPSTGGVREQQISVVLHGKPLALHLSSPTGPPAADALILYASGDGGWFGAAVDMFRRIAGAGYATVGFSAKAFLKLDRPTGHLLNAKQLAVEYEQILENARAALNVSPDTPVILTGWSRGAAFAVLVASELGEPRSVRGVVAIGLSEGEDLEINGPGDETDDALPNRAPQRWPFLPYRLIAGLGPVHCAVIQSRADGYLPAERARELFGPDTPFRRFYAIDAKNHRFSGGKDAFDRALVDAIRWMVPPLRQEK